VERGRRVRRARVPSPRGRSSIGTGLRIARPDRRRCHRLVWCARRCCRVGCGATAGGSSRARTEGA
jgi:hypothetical protein